MQTRQEIYTKLISAYYKTGRIGKAKPINHSHAEDIAYAASLSIYKRNTTGTKIRQGTEPLAKPACCQLKLF